MLLGRRDQINVSKSSRTSRLDRLFDLVCAGIVLAMYTPRLTPNTK